MFTQVLRFRPEGNLMAVTMRTERYRMTRWTDEADRSSVRFIELYDRAADPDEMRNVADDPAYAGTNVELLGQLEAGWRASSPR